MASIPHPSLPLAESHPHGLEHHDLGFVRTYLFSTDHKVIGIQFLFVGLAFLTLGGLLAMVIRWQMAFPADRPEIGLVAKAAPILAHWLGWPGGKMPPDFYNMVFTMHASIMIFFAIIPLLVGVFGNYLIPLKIGAGDMAFPFLNGLAFWSSLPAATIMLAGFFMTSGAAAAGWTSYPPLSALTINNSAWPITPIIMNFIAWFMALAFICTYQVRFGNKVLDALLVIAMSAIGSYFITRGVQHVAFDGQSCWFLSLIILGFTSLMGAVNYITTIVKMRCPGMTMFRMPLSVWSLFITSILILLATPVLAGTLTMNLLDHLRLTSFFLPYNWTVTKSLVTTSAGWAAGGGFPVMHQHLFWFYSHPAVYIMILPAMGMTSDIMAVFARKPIYGYRPMVYAIAGIAFLGFIVWAHHMFQSGMNPTVGTTFAISTMFIAVPSAVKVFNWLGTLWRGNIIFKTPMLFALGFISMFTIGGLSGIFMASTAVDVHIHDTYFIVAHIHYVLFGGSLMGIFASIYFWYPKMFGRMMNETMGKIHFVLTFICMNAVFFPMHLLGMTGMPRRVADYTNYDMYKNLVPMNQWMSYFAFALGLAQILIVVNFFGSWFWGKKAPANPWNATTLEWNDCPSPPPHGNFTTVPVVHHGPYEYSSPLVEEDWLPQTRFVEGAEELAKKMKH